MSALAACTARCLRSAVACVRAGSAAAALTLAQAASIAAARRRALHTAPLNRDVRRRTARASGNRGPRAHSAPGLCLTALARAAAGLRDNAARAAKNCCARRARANALGYGPPEVRGPPPSRRPPPLLPTTPMPRRLLPQTLGPELNRSSWLEGEEASPGPPFPRPFAWSNTTSMAALALGRRLLQVRAAPRSEACCCCCCCCCCSCDERVALRPPAVRRRAQWCARQRGRGRALAPRGRRERREGEGGRRGRREGGQRSACCACATRCARLARAARPARLGLAVGSRSGVLRAATFNLRVRSRRRACVGRGAGSPHVRGGPRVGSMREGLHSRGRLPRACMRVARRSFVSPSGVPVGPRRLRRHDASR